MNEVEVYYFSGTGNSLYAAKELQKRIPEIKLIPIVSLLDKDKIKASVKKIGFVFPLYFTTVPVPVRNFIRRLDLSSAEYIFAVITRLGTWSYANIGLEEILKNKGKKLNSYFHLKMANNSPTGLKPGPGDKNWIKKTTKEKILKMDTDIRSDLDMIQRVIKNNENYPAKKAACLSRFFGNFFSKLTENNNAEIPYYIDSTCTGCGTCENVCLSKKIKLVDKPIWQKDIQCYYCYACFNFCPEQAILHKKYKLKTGRYFHPGILAKDIAGQK